jgi:hypothetical protein
MVKSIAFDDLDPSLSVSERARELLRRDMQRSDDERVRLSQSTGTATHRHHRTLSPPPNAVAPHPHHTQHHSYNNVNDAIHRRQSSPATHAPSMPAPYPAAVIDAVIAEHTGPRRFSSFEADKPELPPSPRRKNSPISPRGAAPVPPAVVRRLALSLSLSLSLSLCC